MGDWSARQVPLKNGEWPRQGECVEDFSGSYGRQYSWLYFTQPFQGSGRGLGYFALAIFLKDPPCPPTHALLYKLQGPQKLDFPLGM